SVLRGVFGRQRPRDAFRQWPALQRRRERLYGLQQKGRRFELPAGLGGGIDLAEQEQILADEPVDRGSAGGDHLIGGGPNGRRKIQQLQRCNLGRRLRASESVVEVARDERLARAARDHLGPRERLRWLSRTCEQRRAEEESLDHGTPPASSSEPRPAAFGPGS